MLALLWVPAWFWHPLEGRGYQAWSGIVSDLGEITIVGVAFSMAAMVYHRFNCHADRCWRLAWHVHDGSGHPVCRHHHPDGDDEPHTIGGTAHGGPAGVPPPGSAIPVSPGTMARHGDSLGGSHISRGGQR